MIPSTDSAQRARERATGDDGGDAVAAAAARPAQQVEGQVVDHRIVNDVDRHPRTEHQIECDYFESRVGARIWWMPNTQAKPPANADPEFAEQVFAFQRGAAGARTIREAEGIRIIVPAPAEALPSAEAITTFARALLDGADWAIDLSIRMLEALAVEREIEAETQARRMDAYRELTASGQDLDLLAGLDAEDPARRLAAEVRAADLAAGWLRRSAALATIVDPPEAIEQAPDACSADLYPDGLKYDWARDIAMQGDLFPDLPVDHLTPMQVAQRVAQEAARNITVKRRIAGAVGLRSAKAAVTNMMLWGRGRGDRARPLDADVLSAARAVLAELDTERRAA